jgi:hypothetical protein
MAAGHRRTILGVVAVALVVAAAVLVQHHRHTRATVGKVASAALHASPRADHVVVDGRTFRLSRVKVGERTLIVAAATDTKGLNEDGAIVRTRGTLSLNWNTAGVRFPDAAGHQTLILRPPGAAPVSKPTRRAMSDLAARLAS